MSQNTKFAWAKPMAWGVALGATLTVVVGFSTGFVTTTGTANDMAATSAREATVTALAPICVELAKEDPEYSVKIAEIEDAQSYQRDNIVEEAGWATLPTGADQPNARIADACLDLLMASDD